MIGKCRPVPECVNYSASETQIVPKSGPAGRHASRWPFRCRPWLLFGVFIVLACSPAPPPHPNVEGVGATFSARLARAHLDALAGLGPRRPDSRADVVARAYLDQELRLAGAETATWRDGARRHPVATLAGHSPDVILLVAAYPVLEADGWIDDAGIAFLLELVRVFGAESLPYTLKFALAETRPRRSPVAPGSGSKGSDSKGSGGKAEKEGIWEPVRSFSAARERVRTAGRSLARATESEGVMDRLRAVIVFDWTARSGLRIARDLRSQPVFRQIFWDAAADLGQTATFPLDGQWASPESLHLGFRERSMDRVLALVDEAVAGANPSIVRPGAGTSLAVLDSMGRVTIEALNRLMRRFQKIDAFSNHAAEP